MGLMWTDELVERIRTDAARLRQQRGRDTGKVARRRRTTDWNLADDLGARTPAQRWLVYMLATVLFLAALVNLTLAWAAGDIVGTTAAGIVTALAAWGLTELGTTVGLGPIPDEEPAQQPVGGPGKSAAL